MPTRIVVVFANGGGAEWPFHMDLCESTEHIGVRIPGPGFRPYSEFQQARDQAYDVARCLVGGPEFWPGVTCRLTRIGVPDSPALAGDSLYGAIAMAAIQLFANGSGAGREPQMRYQG